MSPLLSDPALDLLSSTNPPLKTSKSMDLTSDFKAPKIVDPSVIELEVENGDEWDMPVFAFHDLDYVPSGYGGILAPYIETGVGTMRAAATLMRLNHPPSPSEPQQRVICDLGCGDGEFLIGLLQHINSPPLTSPLPLPPSTSPSLSQNLATTHPPAKGLGIDYSTTLLATASLNTSLINLSLTTPSSPPPTSDPSTTSPTLMSQPSLLKIEWLTYDFNLDPSSLLTQLVEVYKITHIFVYLVPKQLMLPTVRGLLEGLWERGVVVCCHKFMPTYLGGMRGDKVMNLCVYGKGKIAEDGIVGMDEGV